MKRFAFAFGALAAITSSAHASTANREPIYVECSPNINDTVGQSVCAAVKDGFASSPRYNLLTAPSKTGYYFDVDIVSMSATKDGLDSTASVVLTINSGDTCGFLDHSVVLTGLDKIKSQAQTIVGSIDDDVAKVQAYAAKH